MSTLRAKTAAGHLSETLDVRFFSADDHRQPRNDEPFFMSLAKSGDEIFLTEAQARSLAAQIVEKLRR